MPCIAGAVVRQQRRAKGRLSKALAEGHVLQVRDAGERSRLCTAETSIFDSASFGR